MNIYQKRWNRVRQWALRLKDLMDTGHYVLAYEGIVWENDPTMSIIIDNDQQLFCLEQQRDRTVVRYTLYYGNLDWDEGAYTPIEDTMSMLKDTIKLMRLEPVKI